MPLEKKNCTRAAPMPLADKDTFFWVHEDAEEAMPFFNLVVYKCPHCGFYFHALPRTVSR